METFKLRPFVDTDAESLATHLNNRHIWNNLRDGMPSPYSLSDAKAFIGQCQAMQPATELAIEINGEVVGCIGYKPQDDVTRLVGELGYWLSEQYWNQGIMTEVVRMAVRKFFAQSNLQNLVAMVFECNTASKRVLRKNGFRKVGVLRNAIIKNNIMMDATLYEILREELA